MRDIRILPRVAPRAALAEEVPKLIELDLHRFEAVAIFGRERALFAAFQQVMLFGNQLLDVSAYLCVVHYDKFLGGREPARGNPPSPAAGPAASRCCSITPSSKSEVVATHSESPMLSSAASRTTIPAGRMSARCGFMPATFFRCSRGIAHSRSSTRCKSSRVKRKAASVPRRPRRIPAAVDADPPTT